MGIGIQRFLDAIRSEKNFVSTKFKESANDVGIKLQFSGIEAHNSILKTIKISLFTQKNNRCG